MNYFLHYMGLCQILTLGMLVNLKRAIKMGLSFRAYKTYGESKSRLKKLFEINKQSNDVASHISTFSSMHHKRYS